MIARDGSRCVGLMCGRANGETAFLPADGVAVDPALDPTPVLVGLFTALAPVLLEAGSFRHLIDHVALAPLSEAFNNLGFGRGSVFGTQPAQPFAPHPRHRGPRRRGGGPRRDRRPQPRRAGASVDFDSPNPLSRPFWTGLGFETTGYGVRRTLDAVP